jgi:hypothetical protein
VRSTVEPAFIDLIGGGTLTHIFAGADSDYADAGEFLFAIVTTAEFDPWQPLPGDVTGDGQVTQHDIDVILANLGMSGRERTRMRKGLPETVWVKFGRIGGSVGVCGGACSCPGRAGAVMG